jgi:hypothetical protein
MVNVLGLVSRTAQAPIDSNFPNVDPDLQTSFGHPSPRISLSALTVFHTPDADTFPLSVRLLNVKLSSSVTVMDALLVIDPWTMTSSLAPGATVAATPFTSQFDGSDALPDFTLVFQTYVSAIAAAAARIAKNMAEVNFFIVRFLVFSGIPELLIEILPDFPTRRIHFHTQFFIVL